MDRPLRQMRKSPVRYADIPAKRERSRSRGRGPKSPDKRNKELDISDSTKVHTQRRRSSSRNAKSPTRTSTRRKQLGEKVREKSSPIHLFEKSSDFEESIRSSMTPDRAKIENVIRSSVSRFEEVLAEVTPVIKRRNRGDNSKANTNEIGSEGLEHLTLSETIEEIDKRTSINSVFSNNKTNYNINSDNGEYGFTFGIILLMFLLPTLVIISQLLCTQENCKAVPEKNVVTFKRFFDLEASGWYISFLIIQFLLSFIPLGPKLKSLVSKGKVQTYRHNGPASLLLTITFLGGIRHYLHFSLIKVLDKTLPILVTSILCALVIIFFLHCLPVKGSDQNPSANKDNFIYEIWSGKYINPRFGPFDVKISLIRSSLILIVVYNGLLLLKEIETKLNPSEYSMMLIITCFLQILLAVDPLIFESSLISSFVVDQESTGYYLIMSLAILPFWITLIPNYLYFLKPEYNHWIVGVTVSLHFIGHLIYRISCSQNDNFQRYPHSLKSSDVLYSRHPEKLFRGGLRSKIRYPEYTGLLFIVLSWCVACFVKLSLHWVPISVLIITIAVIIFRTKRLDNVASMKHNLAWMTYVSNTPSALIPYIY